jgi:hypothetical protein
MTRFERTVPFIFAASLVASGLARAQGPTVGIWRQVYLPTSLTNQPMSQPVAGNFTGHGYPDIAFLCGGQVGLLAAPAVHNAADPIAIGVAANGIAPTKGPVTTGRDGLAIATASGLKQWWLGRPISTITTGYPDPWFSVAVGDLDGIGAEDFVGIGDDSGHTIRGWLRGAVNQPFELSFPNETITAAIVAQWDGAGAQEICVATNLRLWIGTPTQQTVAERPQLNTGGGQLVRVAMPNYDSLAWLTTIEGAPRLMTTNKDLPGFFCDPSIQIGAVHAMSGQWNDDTYGDLVVTEVNSNVMHVFTNGAVGTSTPGLAQFTNNSEAISPVGLQLTPAALSCTWLGDFNADGLGDLVTLQNLTTAWAFRQAPTTSGASYRPILSGTFTATAFVSGTVDYVVSLDTTSRPPTATHLELLLFNAVTESTSLVLQPAGLSRIRYEVAEGVPLSSFSFPQDSTTAGSHFPVGLVRWIRLVEFTTVELYQPTLFVLAPLVEDGPLDQWETMRRAQAPNEGHIFPMPSGGSNYLWRTLGNLSDGNPGGIEEPPDLPPKPPDPPTPPAPPPPPIN